MVANPHKVEGTPLQGILLWIIAKDAKYKSQTKHAERMILPGLRTIPLVGPFLLVLVNIYRNFAMWRRGFLSCRVEYVSSEHDVENLTSQNLVST